MTATRSIGKMACVCCGDTITVRQNAAGTLGLSCPECDFSAYAKTGTDAHRLIMKKITLKAAPTQAPAAQAPAAKAPAAKAPPPQPAPAVVKRNTVFG